MAVTPEECMKLRQVDEKQVHDLEREIDKHLRNVARTAVRPFPIYVSADNFGKDWLVRDELLKRYRAAGWRLDFIPDQRDGDSYKIEPERPVRNDDDR